MLRCEQLEERTLLSATIRAATYNIEADINGVTTPRPGLYQVLEGIGEEQLQGDVQPLDILALEETTSNSTTIAPIVSNLNSFYAGLAVYSQSPYQATQNGSNADGNGPNGLVYNTKTLNLLASVGVGTPGGPSNGEYRQVVRYEFQPVGDTGSTGIFYTYVAHSKSGGTSADATDRNEEAQIIRNDEATLPANAAVIYMGDFNTTASSDASYQTLTASTSPSGVAQGAGFDPINMPGNWDLNSAFRGIMTESATNLRYRDDHQLVTQNILNDAPGELGYIASTYNAFGNNGTTPEGGSVDSGSDTALNNDLVQDGPTFISASTLYGDLTTASDHLPVVADYALPAGSPTIGVTSVVVNQDYIPVNGASMVAGVATLETDGNSGFTAGNQIVVGGFTGAQMGFDGTYTIATVSGDQITYADSNTANVSTTTFNTAGYAISANTTSDLLYAATSGTANSPTGTQRSMVDSIVYTFNTPVNLAAGAVTLGIGAGTTNGATPATAAPNVILTPLNGGTVWVMTFVSNSNATVTGRSIADGIYTATLNSSLVTAVSGGATMTTTRPTDTFYRLFGDFNSDGHVNSTDSGTLNLSFGLNYLSSSGYLNYFDYLGNGRVNSTDSGELNLNFGSFWSNLNATI
jgi:Endonuclease/Exonuclease/phosphatase family